ncbi:transferrin-binding protein-like solute binding protein [Avibacterium sp. 20-129]|uniref:transferrin-binding protein-like solute binding protein n=1 Tax=Avibacterium sp. 20-129 TaxID=2911525 RepID=UPI002245BE96|nr:transferrin-binding protein-like solute binding protein [Avibacterium sp. 20-129]MCW9698442.1 transferrin-binding protein-like solute binding protein [Avibacterium sp. 20-129]
MNQTVKITLATLMLSALTACSSGGSGSSDEPAANNTSPNTTPSTSQPNTSTNNNATSQPDTSTNNNTAPQPETSTSNNTAPQPETSTSNNTTPQPETSTSNNTTSKFSGYAFSSNSKLGEPANPSSTTIINSDSIDTLVVNGKSYSLIPNLTGISGNTVNIKYLWVNDGKSYVCCGALGNVKDVKIGAVLDQKTLYTFIQGKPTPEDQIPTNGQVVYKGEDTAIFQPLGDINNKGLTNELSVHINADFDNKAVSGTLYNQDGNVFDIQNGKIVGNTIINGEVSVSRQDEHNKQVLNIDNNAQFSAPLNAKFYGENAKEVAGTAHNEKWGVIFAASK